MQVKLNFQLYVPVQNTSVIYIISYASFLVDMMLLVSGEALLQVFFFLIFYLSAKVSSYI